MKALVTGGAGFIGCRLVNRLTEAGFDVVIYDKLVYGDDHSPISYLYGSDWQKFWRDHLIVGDVLDYPESLEKAMVDVDVVFHLAAMLGVENVEAHPVETIDTEISGTDAVLSAALASRKRPHVFVWSTSEVYGQWDSGFSENDLTPVGVGDPRWAYQASKVAADHLAMGYCKEYGLGTTVIRPFNIFGPCQVGHGAICKFINRALRNWDIPIYGDGSQIRSWMYVENLIDAIMTLANGYPSNAIGQIYNVGDPSVPMQMTAVAKEIIARTNSQSKIVYLPKRPVDVDYRVPNADKMNALGWKPRISFFKALDETINWYRNLVKDDYLVW